MIKANSKNSKRFLSFRIRTVLFLVVVLSIGVIIYRNVDFNGPNQRASVEWVNEAGGTVFYDFQHDVDGKFNGKKYPSHLPKLFEIYEAGSIIDSCSYSDAMENWRS